MLAPINLNNKPRLEADEISNVWTYRLLPSELQVFQLPISQSRPEKAFRLRLLTAKPASKC